MHRPSVWTLAGLTLQASWANAFWRLECEGSVGLARLDPLMSFNAPANHVHSIKGGSGFSATSKANDLLQSSCTSCGVAQDVSAYWTPALYFIHDNGTAVVVPEKPPHKTYYLLNSGFTSDGRQQKVEAFPNGFQMIAGNSLRRNSTLPNPDPAPLGPWPKDSQDQLAQRALGFNCLHYAAGNDEASLGRHSLPDKSFLDATCSDGIRLELVFPSCWNGQMDGGPTHKSHVAYPDGVLVGNCPPGYDKRLVTLFYETIVATDYFKGFPGHFALANGDPTGYGYHGDFISAWKDNTLERAVKECDTQVPDGMMSKCPVFQLVEPAKSAQCAIQNPLPVAIQNEKVQGPMQGLANGLALSWGPAPADAAPAAPAPAPAPATPAPAPSPSTPSPAQNNVPVAPLPQVSSPKGSHQAEPEFGKVHAKLAVKNRPAPTSSTVAPPPPPPPPSATPPPPPPPTVKPGEELLETTYSTAGDILYEIVHVLHRVTIDAAAATVTVAVEAGAEATAAPAATSKRRIMKDGYANAKRHLHAHQHHHHHARHL